MNKLTHKIYEELQFQDLFFILIFKTSELWTNFRWNFQYH